MATLKEVAKAANVSLATASYALNDDSRIKEDTRNKVKEIAKKLAKDYEILKVISWKECKEIMDNINESIIK